MHMELVYSVYCHLGLSIYLLMKEEKEEEEKRRMDT